MRGFDLRVEAWYASGIEATFWRVLGRGGKGIVFAMFDRARLIDATEGAGGARWGW